MRSSPERRWAHRDVPEETSPGKLLIPAVGLAAVILIIQAAKGEAPFRGLAGDNKPDIAQELLEKGADNNQLVSVRVFNPDGGNVSFRRDPVRIEIADSSNKLGELPSGTPLDVVPVLGPRGEVWGLFEHEGEEAFIFEEYVEQADGTRGLRQHTTVFDIDTGKPVIWDLPGR